MLARINSGVLAGVEAKPCEVEVDVDDAGIAHASIVGLPDAAVRESLERVRSAMLNCGYRFPQGRVIINLAPADVRKEGPAYDLPIAIGLLSATGVIAPPHQAERSGRPALDRALVAGELALDGRVRPVRGGILLALLAKERGLAHALLPLDNANEAAVVPSLDVLGVSTLTEAVGVLNGSLDAQPTPSVDLQRAIAENHAPIDFAEVRGQEAVKRAIVVAAAGGHNILMLGPPGTGKTMMARALPGILPPLTTDEALSITCIHSAAGLLNRGQGLVTSRPVRTPHHTASTAAIVGGGIVPRPGEISLAHHGVLFLDELPEFPTNVLEALRQPLEDRVVTIARSHGSVRFPAEFMLVAAMNPTHKGTVSAGEQGQRDMQRYLSKLSGPLLDRIDIHAEAPAVGYRELTSARPGSSSADMRAQVHEARQRQVQRQGKPNARLTGKELDALAGISTSASALLGQAMTSLSLSARAYDKIRRVARTIADIASSQPVSDEHIAEAIQYRLLDRTV